MAPDDLAVERVTKPQLQHPSAFYIKSPSDVAAGALPNKHVTFFHTCVAQSGAACVDALTHVNTKCVFKQSKMCNKKKIASDVWAADATQTLSNIRTGG